MYKLGCAIIVIFMLASGCAHKEYNDRVAASNASMFEAYGNAMSLQSTEGGRLALAIAYSTGAGRAQFQREDTVLDWTQGLLPFAALAVPFLWDADQSDTRAITAGGDIFMSSSQEHNDSDFEINE